MKKQAKVHVAVNRQQVCFFKDTSSSNLLYNRNFIFSLSAVNGSTGWPNHCVITGFINQMDAITALKELLFCQEIYQKLRLCMRLCLCMYVVNILFIFINCNIPYVILGCYITLPYFLLFSWKSVLNSQRDKKGHSQLSSKDGWS